jgi:undecaprenyl-diphosphatase
LIVSHFFKGTSGFRDLRWRHGLITGLAQGIGVLPGISRSGITISAGLASGMSREVAGEFSFLLAIPAIVGALLLDIGDIGSLLGTVAPLPLILGALASFLVGVAALRLLLPIVRRGKLVWFAAYLIPLGLIAILFL